MSWRFVRNAAGRAGRVGLGRNSTWRLAGGACPVAAPAPGQDGADGQQPVLDANGRPYVAQPPQPRIDGTLGVPTSRPTASGPSTPCRCSIPSAIPTSSCRASASRPTRRAKSPRPRSRCRCPRARPTSARWICRRLAPRPPSTAARAGPGPGRRLRLRPDDARAAAPEHRPGARCSRLAGRAQARAGALRHAGLLRAPLVFLGRAQQVLCAEPRLGHDGRMPGPSAVTRSQSYRRGTLAAYQDKGAPRGAFVLAGDPVTAARPATVIPAPTSGSAGSSAGRPCRSGRSGFPDSRCALRCRPGCPGTDRATHSRAPIRNTRWLP